MRMPRNTTLLRALKSGRSRKALKLKQVAEELIQAASCLIPKKEGEQDRKKDQIKGDYKNQISTNLLVLLLLDNLRYGVGFCHKLSVK